MKYNIVVIGDVHWGAIKASDLLNQYQFFLSFLEIFPEKIDLVVNVGDATEDKLSLSSKSSQYYSSTLLQQLDIGKKRNFKSRYVVGTKSHENNQYEVFQKLENDSFRIMRYSTVEETLPGLRCLYCPDENIPTEEYMMQNSFRFTEYKNDIMFFHGSFDKVRGNLLEENKLQKLTNIIFQYDYFSRLCYLMIGGHWHDADCFKHMYYTRSYTRWKFEENRKKGFVFICYDTDTKSYFLHRIENPFAPKYYTYHCDSRIMNNIDSFIDFTNKIKNVLKTDIECYIKILFEMDGEPNDLINAGLSLIKDSFFKEKNVTIEIKNHFSQKDKQIQEEKKERRKLFYFLSDPDISFAEKIRKFILDVDGEDIPIDYLETLIYKLQNRKKEKE